MPPALSLFDKNGIPNSSPASNERGFTLLELLVVMFIIGLVTGMAMLSVDIGGRERLLEQEARRLQELIRMASQEAILQAREIGIRVEKDGYRFMTPGRVRWIDMEEGSPLRARKLPFEWRLELIQDEQLFTPTKSDEEEDEEEEEKKIFPQVVYFSSGEATPFQIRLYADDETDAYLLEGLANGKLELTVEEHGE